MSFPYLPEYIISVCVWCVGEEVKKRKVRGKERAFSFGGLLLRFLHSCDKALCCVSPLWLGQAWTSPVFFIHIRDRAAVWLNSAAHGPVIAVHLRRNS